MKSYLLKTALHGVSPMVWRRICLSGNTTLATFHEVIQICFDWDNEYLHYFRIYGNEYGISRPGAFGVFSNPNSVVVDDFEVEALNEITFQHLLQVRTAILNGELAKNFESWYPGVNIESQHKEKNEIKKSA